MNRKLNLLLAPVALLVGAGLLARTSDSSNSRDYELVAADASNLKARFNTDVEKTRVLMLVAPT